MKTCTVSAILKQGMVISTKHGCSNTWNRDVVYKSEDNTVSIALFDSCQENTISSGASIVLKYTNEYFEYLFEGIVSDVRPGLPGIVTIHINKAEEIINIRTFPRYDISLSADLISIWDSTPYSITIDNISLGGLAFVNSHAFDAGEELNISIYISGHETVFVRGKVVHKSAKSNSTSYSIQFTEMSETAGNILSKLLSLMDEKDSRLQTEFNRHASNLL